MNIKKYNTKTFHTIIWLATCSILVFFQYLMYQVSTNNKTISLLAPTLESSLNVIVKWLILISPAVIILGLFIAYYLKYKQYKVGVIIGTLFLIIIMDITMSNLGGYGIKGKIDRNITERKRNEVMLHHPKIKKENILLYEDEEESYYIEKGTNNVLRVTAEEIIILRSWESTEKDIPIFKAALGKVPVSIIKLRNDKTNKTGVFSIEMTGKTYELENGNLLGDGIIESIKITTPIELVINTNRIVISFTGELPIDLGLDFDKKMMSWRFSKDGKSKIVRENSYKSTYGSAPLEMEQGEWSVFLMAYSSWFDDYIVISETLEYTIE